MVRRRDTFVILLVLSARSLSYNSGTFRPFHCQVVLLIPVGCLDGIHIAPC